MQYFETIKTETVNGFDIVFSAAYEYTHPSDLFDETEEDMEKLLDDIDRGSLVWFIARVQACKHGIELGSDYLGGCLYKSYDDFLSDHYYQDMQLNAIDEAKKAIAKLTEEVTA
jgi:hypothetical protein